MISGVISFAKWELQNAVRTKWVLGSGAAFALSAMGVVVLGMRSAGELGLTGIGPAGTSLLGLAMLLPPLVGLMLGAGAVAGARERGTLQMIMTQPGARSSYVAGTFLGLTTALWAVLAAGLGVSGVMLGTVAGAADVRPLLGVAIATFAAATCSVAIGMVVSSFCRTRSQATSWCVVLWFVFGVGADLVLVSLVPALNIGPAGVLSAIAFNPVEAARTLALVIMDPQLTALGPFGAFVTWEFGVVWAILLLVTAQVVWCLGSLGLAHLVVRRAEF